MCISGERVKYSKLFVTAFRLFSNRPRTVRFLTSGKMAECDLCVFPAVSWETWEFLVIRNFSRTRIDPMSNATIKHSFILLRLTIFSHCAFNKKKRKGPACFVPNFLQFTSTMKTISNRMNLLLTFIDLPQTRMSVSVQLRKSDCHDDDWFLIDSKTFRTRQPNTIHS